MEYTLTQKSAFPESLEDTVRNMNSSLTLLAGVLQDMLDGEVTEYDFEALKLVDSFVAANEVYLGQLGPIV